MIARAKPCRPRQEDPQRDQKFLAMLPQIRQRASIAFRSKHLEAREELIAEVVANSYCAFHRLVEGHKEHLACPSPLAEYAIRQVRSGRRVGSRLNRRDVSSPYAQIVNRIAVERLDQFNQDGEWTAMVVEDRKAGPAETAAARIDLAAWLRSLARRQRRIALALARGEATQRVAHMFGLTPSRISQLRRELKSSWDLFQGAENL